MKHIDDLIGQALSAEDHALLASHAEPGYFAQAIGLFRGPMAWVIWAVYLVSALAFVAGAYAVWQMLGATDALVAVKCGVVSLFLFQVAMMGKAFMGNRMEANRLLREIKRVELQVALLRDQIGRAQ